MGIVVVIVLYYHLYSFPMPYSCFRHGLNGEVWWTCVGGPPPYDKDCLLCQVEDQVAMKVPSHRGSRAKRTSK